MRQRKFSTRLGGVTPAWPLAPGAHRLPVPVIDFFDTGAFETRREVVAAVPHGLSETGFSILFGASVGKAPC